MKDFAIYQYLGEVKSERDIKEKDSKFWNEGKWNNFILPLLPADCLDSTFIDVGCNAGLHLKMAKEYGFKNVIGIESLKAAYHRALEYQQLNKLDYKIYHSRLEDYLSFAPVADITLLANVHYYVNIQDWIDYLDKLEYQTCYCLIITKAARQRHDFPALSIADTKLYFKDWELVGAVYDVDAANDPSPRSIQSMLFKSRHIARRPIGFFKADPFRRDFFKHLDRGVPYNETVYYCYWRDKKKGKWSVNIPVDDFVKSKVELYDDIKINGFKKAILSFADGAIVEGMHRKAIAEHLGYKSIISRII